MSKYAHSRTTAGLNRATAGLSRTKAGLHRATADLSRTTAGLSRSTAGLRQTTAGIARKHSRVSLITAAVAATGVLSAAGVAAGTAPSAQAATNPLVVSAQSPGHPAASVFPAVTSVKVQGSTAASGALDSVHSAAADAQQEAAQPAAKQQPAKAQPAKAEPAKAELAKQQPATAQPAKAQPAKAQPAKAQPAKAQPAKAQPAKAQPAKAQPAKAQPAKPKAPAAPAKPYLIYDSVTPGSIPHGQAAAVYANGAYQASPGQMAGHRSVLWIDTNGSTPGANALDVEPGDATPAGAAAWVQQRLSTHPNSVAIVYTMVSDWQQVKDNVAHLPTWMQSKVRYWIADPTGTPHILPGASATQWYWGQSYDITTAAPNFAQ